MLNNRVKLYSLQARERYLWTIYEKYITRMNTRMDSNYTTKSLRSNSSGLCCHVVLWYDTSISEDNAAPVSRVKM